VVHNRDNQEVGVAHEVASPKNPNFPKQRQGSIGLVKLSPKKLSDRPEMLSKVAMEF